MTCLDNASLQVRNLYYFPRIHRIRVKHFTLPFKVLGPQQSVGGCRTVQFAKGASKGVAHISALDTHEKSTLGVFLRTHTLWVVQVRERQNYLEGQC